MGHSPLGRLHSINVGHQGALSGTWDPSRTPAPWGCKVPWAAQCCPRKLVGLPDTRELFRNYPGAARAVPRRCPERTQQLPEAAQGLPGVVQPGNAKAPPRTCPGVAKGLPRSAPGVAQELPQELPVVAHELRRNCSRAARNCTRVALEELQMPQSGRPPPP